MLALFNASGSLIDAIRINAISDEVREGRSVWVKRRRRGSREIIRIANLFFRLARNPVLVCGRIEHWRRREIESFHLLNGDEYRAFPGGPREVCAERLPGESLCHRLSENRLTAMMLAAAGRELRRAHLLHSEDFDGPWSHGDAHLGNFLFEDATGRCRLIDFEAMHYPTLAAEERHANDLLAPLLDLMGRVEDREWEPLALAFVRAYDRPTIAALLRQRLRVPTGIPRLWWAIRCGYISSERIRRRVAALGAALS